MKTENENKVGYKKTKLGWIPEDWEVIKFGDIFSFLKTYSYSRANLEITKNEDSVLNIHYGDIHSTYSSNILDVSKNLHLMPSIKSPNGSYELLMEGDLIIADASEDYEGICTSIEIQKLNNKKLTAGLHTFAARDLKDKTTLGFRCYILRNEIVSKELKKIATGTSVYGVSKKNLSKINIPLPPLAEQRKIADILSAWDKAIETTQNLIEKLQLRKKGLMQQLLTGEKRLPGFSGQCAETTLNNFIRITLRPITKPNQPYLASGLRSHGKGIFHKPNFDPNSIAMDTLYEVKENDLVVNITFAWEHAIAVASLIDEGGLVSHRFPTYTFLNNKSNAQFFKYYFLQKRFKYLLSIISPGGAGRNRVMSKKDFPKLKVLAPTFKEQTAIAQILSKADEEIEQSQQYLETIQQEKKGLMQQLLTGQKRVKLF